MAEIKSPLVQTVLALDNHFSELERLGNKINSLDMKSDFDFEQAQKLMARFSECGEGIATEVVNLSAQLNDVRMRSEEIARGVSARAAMLGDRKTEEQKKMEEFRELGEKVREFSTAMATLKRPEGEKMSDDDKAQVSASLTEFEAQIEPLIAKAQEMRKEAHASKMKTLEQSADSLAQTLLSVRQKLSTLRI